MFKTDIYLHYLRRQMWVSASKHSKLAHRRQFVLFVACAVFCEMQRMRRMRFCFSIFVLYFPSVSVFVPLYDLYVVSKKKTYKLFTKHLMINPCVIEKYIVNVPYVVNDNRLGCFVFEEQTRKITAEFHKVTPVKPFIDYLISWNTTVTWNKCKLVDTLYTIFPYISTKISPKWHL